MRVRHAARCTDAAPSHAGHDKALGADRFSDGSARRRICLLPVMAFNRRHARSLVALLGAAASFGIGCAAERPASAPLSWADHRVVAIDRGMPQAGTSAAWTASGPAQRAMALAGRRDATLGQPPVPSLADRSAWQGRPVREESRRLPIIYSRWGRAY
jgi:hypothetical protein